MRACFHIKLLSTNAMQLFHYTGYCCQNDMSEIKSSNNPVKKTTACPLTGVSRWLMDKWIQITTKWVIVCDRMLASPLLLTSIHNQLLPIFNNHGNLQSMQNFLANIASPTSPIWAAACLKCSSNASNPNAFLHPAALTLFLCGFSFFMNHCSLQFISCTGWEESGILKTSMNFIWSRHFRNQCSVGFI